MGPGDRRAVEVARTPQPIDGRHPTGSDPWWGEAWGFDWGLPDGSLGGFVEVTIVARQRAAWFWAAVTGTGRRAVLCRDVDLALPADPDVLELRGDALWTHAICETPLAHWTVAMEAFAVALDDPFDAWHGERGDRIGLAFDLEWENRTGDLRWAGDSGYRVACTVNGDLQVGDESWTSLSAAGHRWHSWGIMAPFAAADHGTNTAGHRVAYLVPSRDGPVRARRQLRPDGTWTI